MEAYQVLVSNDDASVNFVWPTADGQVEARYVRRREDRCIIYLSVMTGCGLGCKMCHLTQTRQTIARHLTVEEVQQQASTVLEWIQQALGAGAIPAVKGVDFSFMARGEFFANTSLLQRAAELLLSLEQLAAERGLDPRVKISTIMPRSLVRSGVSLIDIFGQTRPDIYYSLYSLDPSFRKQWLPRAIVPHTALQLLADWQRESRKIVVLHSAFIAGQNDSQESIQQMGEAVEMHRLRADYNVVRYNPFSPLQGIETAHLDKCVEWLQQALPHSQIKVINRVGPDVYASCGMFVPA